ncbi:MULTISPECIES: DUF6809 family protein [Oscillospiraceae]|uniref:DUF6809 family protein n=1 Tax=Oscillospiraceae TaxID=216572 RepID=UPI0003AE60FE|nr:MULTISPECIES: DUF6809 family protein [unclassified Oscillibacter]ERK64623.1 hypothetical protein HMPREF1545_00375 [Oscillibacter sp. KLE 1728]ERK67166.1 hypothetical protein HMPREF1546_00673 [Oscillibacter sp. KLE 1745]
MNDYMQALHQRFFREPECADVREEIKDLRQELRETLQKPERRKLLRLVDAQNLLREETSLASFMAGFKLAWGLAQELEADRLGTAWCASGRMAAGRAASWWDTRKTVTPSSATCPPGARKP